MTWWGWLLAGIAIGVVWVAAGAVAGARIGARLARNREQEER